MRMNDSGVQEMLESTPRVSPADLSAEKRLKLILPSPIMPLLSSTLNDSLVESVEQLHLRFTPSTAATASAIATTTSHPSTSTTSPAEFIRNHQECMKRTPLKGGSGDAKLGSPERNELISGRRPTAARWTFTPRVVERISPAKKRLFAHDFQQQQKHELRLLVAAHARHDPVYVFTQRRHLPFVIGRIFGSLDGRDLYSCRRVSRAWRAAVDREPALRRAALEFGRLMQVNKENPGMLRRLQGKHKQAELATSRSELKDKFIQLGQNLKENLNLQKCARCQQPQIIEYNIGQCQNVECGYICCFKCHSFTLDGPEFFFDECHSGALDLPKGVKRRTLADSPPPLAAIITTPGSDGGGGGDLAHLYYAAAADVTRDSCYGSYEENSAHQLSGNAHDTTATAASVSGSLLLTVSNGQRGVAGATSAAVGVGCKRARTASLYTPVVPIRCSPEMAPAVDDSPVKDYTMYKGVGSSASKKRLKRTLR